MSVLEYKVIPGITGTFTPYNLSEFNVFRIVASFPGS